MDSEKEIISLYLDEAGKRVLKKEDVVRLLSKNVELLDELDIETNLKIVEEESKLIVRSLGRLNYYLLNRLYVGYECDYGVEKIVSFKDYVSLVTGLGKIEKLKREHIDKLINVTGKLSINYSGSVLKLDLKHDISRYIREDSEEYKKLKVADTFLNLVNIEKKERIDYKTWLRIYRYKEVYLSKRQQVAMGSTYCSIEKEEKRCEKIILLENAEFQTLGKVLDYLLLSDTLEIRCNLVTPLLQESEQIEIDKLKFNTLSLYYEPEEGEVGLCSIKQKTELSISGVEYKKEKEGFKKSRDQLEPKNLSSFKLGETHYYNTSANEIGKVRVL